MLAGEGDVIARVRPVRVRSYAALALVAAASLAGCSVGDDDERPPQLGTKSGDEDAAAKLGFPSTATKNTIRVGGGDATADAAGVASAVFPGTTDATRPTAVVLVDKDDWQAGVTASVLAARPIGAPILISDGGDLPAITADTLKRLDPKGSDLSDDAQVIRIGDTPPRPDGFKTAVIKGKDAYERAAAIDRFFSAAKGKPSKNVVVTSGEEAPFAMPAAAWSAFSGDAVLLTERNRLPAATRKAIAEHEKPAIFVLGPEKVISDRVVKDLKKLGTVTRIRGEDARTRGDNPIENAVAFARYSKGDFGWGLRTPGSNFTIANVDRPLDAAASAALAARGVPFALLLTDGGRQLPTALEYGLANVQPGYEDDRRDVAYSRSWILGDDKAVSLAQQVQIDGLTDLIPIQANEP